MERVFPGLKPRAESSYPFRDMFYPAQNTCPKQAEGCRALLRVSGFIRPETTLKGPRIEPREYVRIWLNNSRSF